MKISKRIGEPTPKKPEQSTGSGFTLARHTDDAIEKDAAAALPGSEPVTATPDLVASPPAVAQADDWAVVAHRLTQLIGTDVVTRIRHYPLLQIAYLPEDTQAQGWLIEALRVVLTLDDVQAIRQQLDNTIGSQERTIVELQQMVQMKQAENEQLQIQAQQLHEKIDELETLRLRATRQLKTRVSIDKVLDLAFASNDPTGQTISQLLKDDLKAMPDDLGAFTLALGLAWNSLKTSLSPEQLTSDISEEQRLQSVSSTLTDFLAQLTGLYVPARRQILNAVATYASARMTHYDFVSPEETKTVNPAIHKTDALGGSLIAEGITFAVLRRDTGQTIRYADVKIEKP